MSETISRKRLLFSFWGVLGLWVAYGFYLWWLFNTYPLNPVSAFPIAIGGLLVIRGTSLLIDVAPKLYGKNRVT